MTYTTMTVPSPTHPVTLVCDDEEYRAECACGWVSDWSFNPADADSEGVCHQDDAARATDAMDLVINDLLDLQDDLAAAVVWLAENWTTGLPTLGWSGCGDDRRRDRPAVRLLGYASPAEMTAAAVVLDTTMIDGPPDVGGRRWRRAIRDFGRVRIQIFADLPALDAESAP